MSYFKLDLHLGDEHTHQEVSIQLKVSHKSKKVALLVRKEDTQKECTGRAKWEQCVYQQKHGKNC